MKLKYKILLSYIPAVTTSVLGIIAGFMIGDYYRNQSIERFNSVRQQNQFMTQLQLDILYNRPTKQIGGELQDPEALKRAFKAFTARVFEIRTSILSAQESFLFQENPELEAALQDYLVTLEKFLNKLEEIAPYIEQYKANRSDSVQADFLQDIIVDFSNSPEFADFINFPDNLARFEFSTKQQEIQAEFLFEKSKRLHLIIIIISLMISIIIGGILAFFISQTITQPLQKAIKVAQKVTHTQDFTLQAPVTTQDEVGMLTLTLNELIQKVDQLLKDRKSAEVRLIQSEKMSSLGRLVGGMAHEINNPISFIYGNITHAESYLQELVYLLELYQEQYPEPPVEIRETIEEMDLDFLIRDLKDLLQSMELGAKRIQNIVQSLRVFSRLDEAAFKAVNLHEGLDSAIVMLQNDCQETPQRPEIQIICDYEKNLPVLECYARELNQVFMNLLLNAIDSLNGAYHRDFEFVPREHPRITIQTRKTSDQQLLIQISDNGQGIPEQYQSQLFDPFFTTKEVGQGTGLGLATSYEIITQQHRGSLHIESHPGQGTTVKIYLPLA